MKIRTSFVTNSSSSSFVVFGIEAESIQGIIFRDQWHEELAEDIFEKMRGTHLTSGGQYSQKIGIETYTILKHFPDIKVSEIKAIVAEEINRAFGTSFSSNDIGYYEEGWYEG